MPMIKKLTTEDLLYDARKNNKKLKQEINNYKQTLEEIRKHISGLEKLLFESTYADDTKRLIMVELQTLRAVLEDNEDENTKHI